MVFSRRTCKLALVTLITLLCTALYDQSVAEDEDTFNESLCRSLGGTREVRHYYGYGEGQRGYVIVDCETDSFVIEGGLDKRSSLDSLQQALFFSSLTGKKPAVVIHDTDGKIGKYEHRIRVSSEKAGVLFLRLPSDSRLDRETLAGMLRGRP